MLSPFSFIRTFNACSWLFGIYSSPENIKTISMEKVIYIVVAVVLLIILFKILRIVFYVALVVFVFYFIYDQVKDKIPTGRNKNKRDIEIK